MAQSFMERWDALKDRNIHYFTLKLDSARGGSDAPSDQFLISGDVFFVLRNDASDLSIAFSRSDAPLIPIPSFAFGKGKVKIVQAFTKIYLKHSAFANGQLIIASGFPESVDIDIIPAIAQSSVFNKDASVTSTPSQLDTDYIVRDAITLLADNGNSAVVKVGNSTNQLFPLIAGSGITLTKVKPADIYLVAVSGTQTIHALAGGGV